MHTLLWSQPGGLVVPWATIRGGRGSVLGPQTRGDEPPFQAAAGAALARVLSMGLDSKRAKPEAAVLESEASGCREPRARPPPECESGLGSRVGPWSGWPRAGCGHCHSQEPAWRQRAASSGPAGAVAEPSQPETVWGVCPLSQCGDLLGVGGTGCEEGHGPSRERGRHGARGLRRGPVPSVSGCAAPTLASGAGARPHG